MLPGEVATRPSPPGVCGVPVHLPGGGRGGRGQAVPGQHSWTQGGLCQTWGWLENRINSVKHNLYVYINSIHFYYYGAYSSLRSIQVVYGPKSKRPFSMNYREPGSHDEVCIPHSIPCTWVRQEEDADTKIIIVVPVLRT